MKSLTKIQQWFAPLIATLVICAACGTAAADLCREGDQLLGAGKLNEAAETFSKLIEQNPDDTRGYYGRGSAHSRMGDFDAAIEDFSKVIELEPKASGAYYMRGLAYHKKGAHDLALADFNRAIELEPGNGLLYYNRGLALNALNEPDKAMADFNKAIQLDPKSAKALCHRAAAWLGKGDFEKAIADATRSIELNPQEAMSFRIRAGARKAMGDIKGGEEDARQALILGPQPPPGMAAVVAPQIIAREQSALKALLEKDTPENRAQLAAVRHDHAFAILDDPEIEPGKEALEEAVCYARSASALEPGDAGHLFLTGLLFRELEKKDERAAVMAEQALRKAVEVEPEYAASWLALGLMMAEQKRAGDAMTALEHALRSDPARVALDATGTLCAMYALNGELSRGCDFFRELYAANPEVSALGVGSAIMFDSLGDRSAAIAQAQDVMAVEAAGTTEHDYAAKLLAEWRGEKP